MQEQEQVWKLGLGESWVGMFEVPVWYLMSQEKCEIWEQRQG